MGALLRACPYCGNIHPDGYVCAKKPKKRWEGDKRIRQFRNTQQWITKREHIKERDKYLCQACLNNLPGTTKRITMDGLSVHHINPLSKAWDLRLEDDNLITLCSMHHELADSGKIKAKQLKELIKQRNISPHMPEIEFESAE